MKLRTTALLLAVLFTSFAGVAIAQVGQRDPLSPKEADDLRETTQEPEKRIKLYLDYARARLMSIEQLRGDPKVADERPTRIHDLLQDFREIVDEMDDYIDDNSSRYDMRKPLKLAVEQESDFLLKLRALKDAPGNDAKAQAEARQYGFALQDAMEAVNLSADDTRKTLEEQELAYKERKKKK